MAPLRRLSFRLLIAGELVSNFGDGIYRVALSWYVLVHSGGALLLGTVLAAYGVPRTLLLVVGGHASDRYRPASVMLVANCTRGIAVAAFALAAAVGSAREPILIPIAIVLGAGEGIYVPASSAIVPALLPRGQWQAGNSLSDGTTQLSQLAGPALGGLLVALTGPAQGFAIDALTFAFSALTLVGVRRGTRLRPGDEPHGSPDDSPGTRPAGEAATNLIAGPTLRSLLADEPILRLMLVTDAIVNLGSAGMSSVALPALVRGPLHLGVTAYGTLSAALGAGLLLGTITASSMPQSRRPLRLASLTLLPTAPLIAAIPYAGGLIPTAIFLVVAFLLIAVGNLVLITSLQQWAPPGMVGRLTGVLMLASVGMMPVSVLVAGIVIRLVGPTIFFPLDAATILVATTVQLSSPAWRRFDPVLGSAG